METTVKVKKYSRTIDKIITKCDCRRGAPMGRGSKIPKKAEIDGKKIFDCAVPMSDGAYDKGGAYWGYGSQLRVRYTKDLSLIHFYRVGDEKTFKEKFGY